MLNEAERRKRFSYALRTAMEYRRVSARALAKWLDDIDPRQVTRWQKGVALPDVYQTMEIARRLMVSEELFRNPPEVPVPPPYPLERYLVDEAALSARELVAVATAEAVEEGARRARRPPAGEAPSAPAPSPKRSSRAGSRG